MKENVNVKSEDKSVRFWLKYYEFLNISPQISDESDNMSRERQNKMYDWHRIFVQAIMSRGIMTGTEVFSLGMQIILTSNVHSVYTSPAYSVKKIQGLKSL